MPRVLLACLACLALALAACAPRETAVERATREQTLLVAINPEPATLDPHLAEGLSQLHVLTALGEGLLGEPLPTAPGIPTPGVATRWEISADGLAYTFHLRPDALWSDGTPLTAADFVASVRRALTPALGTRAAHLLYPLQRAEAYHRGALTDFAQVGITALDTHTLRLNLEHPSAHFLGLLTHPVWFPVPIHVIRALGEEADPANPWARPATWVGNGPYILSAWRPGQELLATVNPRHRDAAALRLRAVRFIAFDSTDAQERAYRAGQLHVTDAVPAARIPAWQAERPAELRIDPFLDTYFFRLNTLRAPFNDVRVRRALALAVDRAALAQTLWRAGQTPALAFTHPAVPGYIAPVSALRYAPAEARALLIAAGHAGGAGLPPMELSYNTSDAHRQIAEALQHAWRTELGLDVRLLAQEANVLLAARRAGEFQVLRSSWVADYADPLSFLELFTARSENNFTGWSHADYDRWLYAAARERDPAARSELLRQAEALLLAEAPVIPLYHNTHAYLLHPAVHGWASAPLDRHAYHRVWLE
jgi:oligopeptide transport system substrate-binding protein